MTNKKWEYNYLEITLLIMMLISIIAGVALILIGVDTKEPILWITGFILSIPPMGLFLIYAIYSCVDKMHQKSTFRKDILSFDGTNYENSEIGKIDFKELLKIIIMRNDHKDLVKKSQDLLVELCEREMIIDENSGLIN